jgi:hypothetical protein
MSARTKTLAFLVEAVSVVVVAPAAFLVAIPGAVRLEGRSQLSSLFLTYGVLLLYFGAPILVSASASGATTAWSRKFGGGRTYAAATTAPAFMLPLTVLAWLIVAAKTSIPLIQNGAPYLSAAVVAGVVVGLVYIAIDRAILGGRLSSP